MKNTVFNEFLSYVISISAIAMLWALFYKFACPKVSVEINEASISFKSNKGQISPKPLLYISKVKKRNRLLCIGQEFSPTEPSLRIDLFNYDAEGNVREYLECVAAFFRYGFQKVIGRNFFVVPKVTIKGAENLFSKFGALTPNSFAKAIRQAGAIECNIE